MARLRVLVAIAALGAAPWPPGCGGGPAAPDGATAPDGGQHEAGGPLPIPDGEPLPLVDAVLSTHFFGAAEDTVACRTADEDNSSHAADAVALSADRFVAAFARVDGAIQAVVVEVSPGVSPTVTARITLDEGAQPWVRATRVTSCGDLAPCAIVAWESDLAGAPVARAARVWGDGRVAPLTDLVGAHHPAVVATAATTGGTQVLLATVEDTPGPRRSVMGRLVDPATGTAAPAFMIAAATTAHGGALGARRFHRTAVAFAPALDRFLAAWDASAPEAPGGVMLAAQITRAGTVMPAPPSFGLAGEDCDTPCVGAAPGRPPQLHVNADCRVKAFWLAGAREGVGGPSFAFTKYGCGGNGLLHDDFTVTAGPDTQHAYKALAASAAVGAAFEWLQARGDRDTACGAASGPFFTARLRFAPGAVAPGTADACGVSAAQHLGQAVAAAAPVGPTLYLHTDRVCAPGAAPARLFATVRFD